MQRHVSELFEQSSLPMLVFKGPTLAIDAYGDLSLRECGDLDMLIRPDDFPRVKEMLDRPMALPACGIKLPAKENGSCLPASFSATASSWTCTGIWHRDGTTTASISIFCGRAAILLKRIASLPGSYVLKMPSRCFACTARGTGGNDSAGSVTLPSSSTAAALPIGTEWKPRLPRRGVIVRSGSVCGWPAICWMQIYRRRFKVNSIGRPS